MHNTKAMLGSWEVLRKENKCKETNNFSMFGFSMENNKESKI